ncbi:hypothetical protein IFM89_021355 [Coptis chinensis]|uniref:Bidirectional sugar transporter SWEET n=1 Tax=Coptis chinensis TaxID=261450 RepID=A0A835IBE0_9MAGN|nr:hypothetical protein IFM89_021355 [Coptis chinensis]
MGDTLRLVIGMMGNAASLLLYAAPMIINVNTIMGVQKKVSLMTIPVIALFCIIVFVSTFALHNHRQRKILVGSIGLVASIAMYGSPLVVMKQVIQTKSVEFMPFYLSLFSLLASALWMFYGLLGRDLFLAAPNLVGCPLGISQIVLYWIYRKKGIIGQAKDADLEKNEEKLKVREPIVNSAIEKIELLPAPM